MTFANVGSLGTKPGQRDAVVAILLRPMPELRDAGCLLYEVGINDDQPDNVYVCELWESPQAHQANSASRLAPAVSFPAGTAGLAYLLGMAEERPGELTGQISINELLIAMGEAPVVSMIDLTVPDDASSLTDGPPTLPGL